MNDSAVSICVLKDILIDPDFESVCPPLTEEEFSLLEQNILSDGEVTSPLIVWNNKLIDGHHRRQIIRIDLAYWQQGLPCVILKSARR